MKYLKFIEEMKHGDVLIWKKEKEYKVTFENNELYYVESEISDETCGIEKKCEGNRFKIVEKDDNEVS